jgi:hypothetical protein
MLSLSPTNPGTCSNVLSGIVCDIYLPFSLAFLSSIVMHFLTFYMKVWLTLSLTVSLYMFFGLLSSVSSNFLGHFILHILLHDNSLSSIFSDIFCGIVSDIVVCWHLHDISPDIQCGMYGGKSSWLFNDMLSGLFLAFQLAFLHAWRILFGSLIKSIWHSFTNLFGIVLGILFELDPTFYLTIYLPYIVTFFCRFIRSILFWHSFRPSIWDSLCFFKASVVSPTAAAIDFDQCLVAGSTLSSTKKMPVQTANKTESHAAISHT